MNKKDKTIMINIEKCLACKSCEIACAVAHSKSGVLEEAITEWPEPEKRVTVEAAEEFGVPMQCRHCEDAPCVAICPTGAIYQGGGEGLVLIDNDLCIGCKLCMLVCPFGVLRIGKEGRVVIKCDMCYERLREGKPPVCVEACPTRAMECVSIEEVIKSRRRKAAEQIAGESCAKKPVDSKVKDEEK